LGVAADLLGVPVSGEALAKLFPPGKELDVLAALKESLSDIWMNGILSEEDRETDSKAFRKAWRSTSSCRWTAASPFRTVALADLPSVERRWRLCGGHPGAAGGAGGGGGGDDPRGNGPAALRAQSGL
jgi:hypothetical protein